MVIDGYFENGIFTPYHPVISYNGRQKARLIVKEIIPEHRQREKAKKWKRSKWFPAFDASFYNGEQEKLLLKKPENIIEHIFT